MGKEVLLLKNHSISKGYWYFMVLIARNHLFASFFRKRPSEDCCLYCASNLGIEGDVLLVISFISPLLLNCFYPKLFCQPFHNILVFTIPPVIPSCFSTLIFSSRARTLYAIAEKYTASTFSFGYPARSKPAASDFAKTTQVELTGGGSSATWNERSPTS